MKRFLDRQNGETLYWRNVFYFAALHLVAAYALGQLIAGTYILATILMSSVLFVCCGVSITAGYHRLFSHRSYAASKFLQAFFLFFGAATMQGSLMFWAGTHRRHHARTDEEGDPHNRNRGFLWSHIGWLLVKSAAVTEDPVPDLEKNSLVRLQEAYYLPLAIFAAFLLPMLLASAWGDPWGGLLVGGVLRLVIQYNTTWAINSLAHTFGSRRYSKIISAGDNFIVALLTFGEGWHNFHHRHPVDYRNGIRWYHWDPTKWLIKGASWLGLARELWRTPKQMLLASKSPKSS